MALAEKVATRSSIRRCRGTDIEWMRSIWNGPIVLKGVQTVDDARIAVDHGVDAIAVSNHGGRQLDGAPAIARSRRPRRRRRRRAHGDQL